MKPLAYYTKNLATAKKSINLTVKVNPLECMDNNLLARYRFLTQAIKQLINECELNNAK